MPSQEHTKASDHTVNVFEEPDFESKFAIERDYLNKIFNEIEGDKIADKNNEGTLTRFAYDERNSHVM